MARQNINYNDLRKILLKDDFKIIDENFVDLYDNIIGNLQGDFEETIGNDVNGPSNSSNFDRCYVDHSKFENAGNLKEVRIRLHNSGNFKIVHFRNTSGNTWSEIANYDLSGTIGNNYIDVSELNIEVQQDDTFGVFSETVSINYLNSLVDHQFLAVGSAATLGNISFTTASRLDPTGITGIAMDFQFTASQEVVTISERLKNNETKLSNEELERKQKDDELSSRIDNSETILSRFSGRIGTTGHVGRMALPFDNNTPKTFRRIFTLSQHCDYVRVGFVNGKTSDFNIAKASVTSLDTTTNFDCTGLTWSNLSFSGNSNGQVPAALGAGRRGILVSDWLPFSSLIPSDDVNALPKIAVSAYVDTAETLTLMGNSGGTTDFTNWATHPTRPMVMRISEGDCVTTPSNFTDQNNKSTSVIGFVQYVARGQVVTVFAVGDSIANGEGAGIQYAGQSEAFLAVDELSDIDGIAYDFVNLGWSGTTTDHITEQVLDILKANVLPDIMVIPINSPNGTPTPITESAIKLAKQRYSRSVLECEKRNIKTVITTWMATNADLKDYNDSDSLRRDYNNEIRALSNKGVVVADYANLIDGVIDGDGQVEMNPIYTSDGIHPNDAGKAALKDILKNAILYHEINKSGEFVPIEENQYGTHPEFTTEEELFTYLISHLKSNIFNNSTDLNINNIITNNGTTKTELEDGSINLINNTGENYRYIEILKNTPWIPNHRYYISIKAIVNQYDKEDNNIINFSIIPKYDTPNTIGNWVQRESLVLGEIGEIKGIITTNPTNNYPDANKIFIQFGNHQWVNGENLDITFIDISLIDLGVNDTYNIDYETINYISSIIGYNYNNIYEYKLSEFSRVSNESKYTNNIKNYDLLPTPSIYNINEVINYDNGLYKCVTYNNSYSWERISNNIKDSSLTETINLPNKINIGRVGSGSSGSTSNTLTYETFGKQGSVYDINIRYNVVDTSYVYLFGRFESENTYYNDLKDKTVRIVLTSDSEGSFRFRLTNGSSWGSTNNTWGSSFSDVAMFNNTNNYTVIYDINLDTLEDFYNTPERSSNLYQNLYFTLATGEGSITPNGEHNISIKIIDITNIQPQPGLPQYNNLITEEQLNTRLIDFNDLYIYDVIPFSQFRQRGSSSLMNISQINNRTFILEKSLGLPDTYMCGLYITIEYSDLEELNKNLHIISKDILDGGSSDLNVFKIVDNFGNWGPTDLPINLESSFDIDGEERIVINLFEEISSSSYLTDYQSRNSLNIAIGAYRPTAEELTSYVFKYEYEIFFETDTPIIANGLNSTTKNELISEVIEQVNVNNGDSANYITCWGDSLTAGGGWTSVLSSLSGRTLYNAGTGGENAQTIMARQGGDVMIVNNITIPSTTTPVIIADRDVDGGIKTYLDFTVRPLLQGGVHHVNPCFIGGIEGALQWTGVDYADTTGDWVFTRNETGDEMVINRPTAIRTHGDVNWTNGYLDVIFIGQNGGWNDADDLVNKHKLMIDHSNSKHTIILGLSSGTSVLRADYENAMISEFGRYFISLRQYLSSPIYDVDGETIISSYGLDDAGYTPTQSD